MIPAYNWRDLKHDNANLINISDASMLLRGQVKAIRGKKKGEKTYTWPAKIPKTPDFQLPPIKSVSPT